MSITTQELIDQYEALPLAEKQIFANEILRRLPPIDSGPLEDDLVAAAGDQLASILEEEEYGSQAR